MVYSSTISIIIMYYVFIQIYTNTTRSILLNLQTLTYFDTWYQVKKKLMTFC